MPRVRAALLLAGVLVVVAISLLVAGCGAAFARITLSDTPGARFMNELNHEGIGCFMLAGHRPGSGMAIEATVQVTAADENATAYKAIGDKILAIARTYGGTALKADTLDVRMVSVTNHHDVLDEQTFPLPASPSNN